MSWPRTAKTSFRTINDWIAATVVLGGRGYHLITREGQVELDLRERVPNPVRRGNCTCASLDNWNPLYHTVFGMDEEKALRDIVSTLRARLHEAVDAVADEFLRDRTHEPLSPKVHIVGISEEWEWPWTYRWPAGQEEPYQSGAWYRVEGLAGASRVLVARTSRAAWGRLRERVVVFGQVGDERSRTFYPWTEFVETDEGDFAATIPNPSRPRSLLTAGHPLPNFIDGSRVRRSDELFGSIQEGPSLRYVLDSDDVHDMIRHGYWVASLRGRIRWRELAE